MGARVYLGEEWEFASLGCGVLSARNYGRLQPSNTDHNQTNQRA